MNSDFEDEQKKKNLDNIIWKTLGYEVNQPINENVENSQESVVENTIESTKDEVDEALEKDELELLAEGWFDRAVANYRANRAGSKVDRYNQRLNDKMNSSDPKFQITGKYDADGNVVAKRTMGEKSKLSKMHQAKINSVTNGIYKDLVKLGIIMEGDVFFKDALANFLKALSILSIYEHSPMSGKKWTWTEVSRQLLEKYIRPSFEGILKNKKNSNGLGL